MNSEETMFSKRDLEVTKDNILSAISRVLDTHFSSINDLVEENHNYEEIKELIANIPFVKNMNRELIESRITIKQLERELAHAHNSDVEEDDKIKLVVKEVDNSRRKELSINDIRQMDEFTKQDEQLATYNFIGDEEGLEDAKRIRVMPYAMPIGGTPRINFWNNESDDDIEGCYGKEYVSNPVGRMLDVEPTAPVENCEDEGGEEGLTSDEEESEEEEGEKVHSDPSFSQENEENEEKVQSSLVLLVHKVNPTATKKKRKKKKKEKRFIPPPRFRKKMKKR